MDMASWVSWPHCNKTTKKKAEHIIYVHHEIDIENKSHNFTPVNLAMWAIPTACLNGKTCFSIIIYCTLHCS